MLRAIDVLGEIFDFVSESLDANDLTLARLRRDIDSAWEEFVGHERDRGQRRDRRALRRRVPRATSARFVDSIVDRVLEIVRAVVADVAEPLLRRPRSRRSGT